MHMSFKIIDFLLRKPRNRKVLDYMEIHVTNHCNLNCACCCHFAPLAETYFMPIDIFKKDIERMSYLSKGKILRLRLMGGEPLLHPSINEFMEISRYNFPNSDIAIHSNGILLSQMSDDFWVKCCTNNIGIILSYYPIDIDYTLLCKKARLHNVVLKIEIDTNVKLFRNFKMDLKGLQNPKMSWYHCHHGNSSVNLFEGKLYTCDILAHSKHLSKYFNLALEYTKQDCIDIYEEKNMKDILCKLNKPHPFCKYCCPNDSKIIEWKVSKKELQEWAKI